MDRKKFIKQIVQIILLSLLALVVFITGGKVVTGMSCISCPGNGICQGRSDCSKY